MGPRVGAWVCQWRRDVRSLGPTMTHRTREIAKSLSNSTNSPECILYLLLWQSRRVGWDLGWVGGWGGVPMEVGMWTLLLVATSTTPFYCQHTEASIQNSGSYRGKVSKAHNILVGLTRSHLKGILWFTDWIRIIKNSCSLTIEWSQKNWPWFETQGKNVPTVILILRSPYSATLSIVFSYTAAIW